MGQLYYLSGLNDQANNIFPKVIEARHRHETLFTWMLLRSPFKIQDPCHAGAPTCLLLGNYLLYGMCSDTCHGGNTYIFIFYLPGDHTTNFKLVKCSKRWSDKVFHLQTGATFEMATSFPAYSFIGHDFFMLDRMIFTLADLQPIYMFPYLHPDQIFYTDSVNDDFVIYNTAKLSLQCAALSFDTNNSRSRSNWFNSNDMTNFRVELLSQTNLPGVNETIIKQPNVTWQCTRSRRIIQISKVSRDGDFLIFSMYMDGSEKYFNCLNFKNDFPNFPQELISQPFKIVLNTCFVETFFRVIFIVDYHEINKLQVVVIDFLRANNEWVPVLSFTTLNNCKKYFNFFPGLIGELFVHLYERNEEKIKLLFSYPHLPIDESFPSLTLLGNIKFKDLPTPFYKIYPVSQRNVVPFFGPLHPKYYDMTSKKLVPNLGPESNTYYKKHKNYLPFVSSTYIVSCYTEFKSSFENLYLLECNSRKHQNSKFRMFKYNLNDFSVQRYMTQKENRDNWRPAHVRALTTFANESVPQDLLILKSKQALDGGLNWKIEIKVASLIEPQ